jgi:hypothetical protein
MAHTQPHTLMSATAAKATRRQLRRSVGDTAIGAIVEQGARLHTVDEQLGITRQDIEWLRRDTDRIQGWIRVLGTLTLWQRLRWLFTGSIHGIS